MLLLCMTDPTRLSRSHSEMWSGFSPPHRVFFSERLTEPTAGDHTEAHTRFSKHLLDLSIAEAEVMTIGHWGYLCLSLHITSIAGKQLYRFGQEAKQGFTSTNTQKHIKGSEPQRSIVAEGSALLCCPLSSSCTEAKWHMWKQVITPLKHQRHNISLPPQSTYQSLMLAILFRYNNTFIAKG